MAEKSMNFEAAMARLEQIVALLERGETPLDESLTLFEEGAHLMKCCAGLLDKAEQKLVKLTAGPNGTAVETPFSPEEEHDGLL